MEIKIAREKGYCYGVRDAVDLAIDESKKSNSSPAPYPVYSLGPIIHNKQTIEMLENQYDVTAIDSVEDAKEGSTVVIRTHGTTPEKISELQARNVNIVDATCPFVQKTQRKAKEFVDNGYFLAILGKKAHPEVVSIAGFAGGEITSHGTVAPTKKCAVVEHKEDLKDIPRSIKIAVVFQSTVTMEDFSWALTAIAEKAYELRVLKTICSITITRQKSVDEVAKEVDTMIIIGGKNSSNTKKLVEVAEQYVRTYHIENSEELDAINLTNVNTVGIGTGTSTPDSLVDEVVERLHIIANPVKVGQSRVSSK